MYITWPYIIRSMIPPPVTGSSHAGASSPSTWTALGTGSDADPNLDESTVTRVRVATVGSSRVRE